MDKLDVKLIALDLDDTLLNDNRGIDDYTVEVLQECAEKGIYVVLCSGRAEDGILPFVRRLNIAGKVAGKYVIAINGCSIFDMHLRQQIYCKKIDGDILVRANEIVENYGLRTEVYTSDTIYFRQKTKYTMLDVEMCGLKYKEIEDYPTFLKEGYTKMLIPGDPKQCQELQRILKEEFGDRAVIFTSKPYFLELLPPNCGKGESVTWLSEHIGFGKEYTMGFGDGMNDESLIRMCKYGVAMKNGVDYIRNIADYITEEDNNHDGVGKFIRKYVL